MPRSQKRPDLTILPDGRIALEISAGGQKNSVEMDGRQTSDLIHALLKASMVSWLQRNDLSSDRVVMPLQGMQDIYAASSWPLVTAVFAPAADEHRPAIGLVAAFGDTQMAFGLQRNQIRRYGEQLIKMDETLPPSDHFELGLGEDTTH